MPAPFGPGLPPDWAHALTDAVHSPAFARLRDFVAAERRTHTVHPEADHTFAAFHATPFADVRAVLLGQDPYHGPEQAHGLAFSVRPGLPIPPSLRNIHREWQDDLGLPPPDHGSLAPWARNGVLLLNTVLTVRTAEPLSHRGKGWETFTDAVIRAVAAAPRPTVFLLWGKPAQRKANLLDETRHTVLRAAHPSPLSARRGFFGSRPFSRTNHALQACGRAPVDWSLPPLQPTLELPSPSGTRHE